MKKLLAVALMTMVSCGAFADSWKKLGERKVSFGNETDVIHVSGLKGKYNKISLRVTDAPVRLNKITVVFGNGKKQQFFINKRLEKGQKTRAFALLNGPRIVNKVELDYKKAAGGGFKSAEVKLYGLKD